MDVQSKQSREFFLLSLSVTGEQYFRFIRLKYIQFVDDVYFCISTESFIYTLNNVSNEKEFSNTMNILIEHLICFAYGNIQCFSCLRNLYGN